MADSIQLICSVCYKASSHKPNPTLTPESKTVSDGKKRTCGVCRQEWVPIRVAKELGQGTLVIIRPRPRNVSPAVDYQICNKREQCPRRDQCTFAHSAVELLVWTKEREKDHRPPPHNLPEGHQYSMCAHVLAGKVCPYSVRCINAHSREELEEWERLVKERPPASSAPATAYICKECDVSCTSQQQLSEHVAARHGSSMGGAPDRRRSARPRPRGEPPATGYRMCLHVAAGKNCVYGEHCTFAHSQEELDAWNRQFFGNGVHVPAGFQDGRFPRPEQLHGVPPQFRQYVHQNQSLHHPPPPRHAEQRRDRERFETSGLGEVSNVDGSQRMRESNEALEFARQLRDRIINDGKSASFQETKNGVSIIESTKLGFNLKRQEPAPIEWVFDITTTSLQVFKSVVLLDQLTTDYSIEGVRLLHPQGGVKIGNANPNPSVPMTERSIRWNIAPGEKAQVKIHVKPRIGILSQVVIFDFEQFYLLQGLTVHYLGEKEVMLLESIQKKPKPTKKDLYWEQRYEKIPYPPFFTEEGDMKLPEFALPEKVEKLLEQGKYNNVENKITKDNYKRRMHNLLYLEEYQQRKDMSRYDMYDVEVTLQNSWEDFQKGTTYAPKGISFIVLNVDETLYEGGRSIKPNDWAYLHPVNKQAIYECFVEHVGKSTVVLKITEVAAQACKESMSKCSIRFILSNVPMRAMHYAVDQLDLEVLFSAQNSTPTADPPGIKRCLDDLDKLELYTKQKNAIRGMLESQYQKVPSLVLGPFGCGKTRTLSECIKLLALHVQDAKILVCAHSNSAADLYVEALGKEWRRRGLQKAPLFRLYFSRRKLEVIPAAVRPYCNIQNNWPVVPSLDEIKEYKIVVTTLMTARTLYLMGIEKGYFTHIFIDEAAQALEAECLIPLCLANPKTKITLAGDHRQLDPPVYSPVARKYGLQQSLLERLFDSTEMYGSENIKQHCKMELVENYRSHETIMGVLSKLFYNDELVCKVTFDSTFPPISFVGVDGSESQQEGSPSYYNAEEAVEVMRQVRRLMDQGFKQEQICVLSFYSGQVQHIRLVLRSEHLGQVVARRVDDVQGYEYRALIVSTVRTCADFTIPAEEEIDFLSNPKLFTAALTRAQEVLIVVGDPTTLCSVGTNHLYWVEYVRRCAEMKSFIYRKPDLFLQQMRTRQATRKLLASYSRKQPGTAYTQATSTATSSLAGVGAAPSLDVIRAAVAQSVTTKDDTIINKIADQLKQLKPEELTKLMQNVAFFTSKMQEMERVIKSQSGQAVSQPATVASKVTTATTRVEVAPQQLQQFTSTANGNLAYPMPPAVNMAVTSAPPFAASLGSDLPSFLLTMIDALSQYSRFCDNSLQNPHLSSDARSSLEKQKATVLEQIKLTNDQITHYRTFMSIVNQAVALVKEAARFSNPLLAYPVGNALGLGELQFAPPSAPTFTYFSMSQDTRGLTQPVRMGRPEGNGMSQSNGHLSQVQAQKEEHDIYRSEDELD